MPQETQHLRLVGDHGTGISDPILTLEADHAAKLELCALLELIADGLPHTAEASLAGACVPVLRKGLAAHLFLEECVLFPLMRRRRLGDAETEVVLQQLEQEHSSDEWFANEIAEELEGLCSVQQPRNPEMLGYMLRGFFVSVRRHVGWENATVLRIARRSLSSADLDELSAAIELQRREEEGRQILEDILKNDLKSKASSVSGS